MGRILSSFFAAILGGLVVLVGMNLQGGGFPQVVTAALPPLIISQPVAQPTATPPPTDPAITTLLAAFRAAKLEVGEVQQITADSPCHYADGPLAGSVQFAVGRERQGFCIFHAPEMTKRDALWNAFSKARTPYPPRITVQGPLVLIYFGADQNVALRYENALAKLNTR